MARGFVLLFRGSVLRKIEHQINVKRNILRLIRSGLFVDKYSGSVCISNFLVFIVSKKNSLVNCSGFTNKFNILGKFAFIPYLILSAQD